MNQDYVIRIDGLQEQDGEENTISLSTKGSYVVKNSSYYITYNETEATGFKDCVTTVKVTNDKKVSMLRFGPMPSQLVIESGERHVCHYETGAGAISLGVSGEDIKNELNKNGGSLKFSYILDMNCQEVSRNEVNITVKHI